MKLSAKDRATLERIARPGYRFSLKNWPPNFEPQPYEPPHYMVAVQAKNLANVRESASQAYARRKLAAKVSG